LLLSEEFNRPPTKGWFSKQSPTYVGPLVFGTYQSYLVRQPQFLMAMLKQAEDNGFSLGIKLVRGAYFVQERQRWKDEGREGVDPIWPNKPATDTSYNNSINTILLTLTTQISSPHPERALAVVFGTHNPESVDLIIDGLNKFGLATKAPSGRLKMRDDVMGRVFIAQLYGMKDELMDKVTDTFEPSGMPVSLKYIAYGKLSEVMPFLSRRAIENKSVMSGEGGAASERRRISKELWRRIFG